MEICMYTKVHTHSRWGSFPIHGFSEKANNSSSGLGGEEGVQLRSGDKTHLKTNVLQFDCSGGAGAGV